MRLTIQPAGVWLLVVKKEVDPSISFKINGQVCKLKKGSNWIVEFNAGDTLELPGELFLLLSRYGDITSSR
jgi:hypothetical protein